MAKLQSHLEGATATASRVVPSVSCLFSYEESSMQANTPVKPPQYTMGILSLAARPAAPLDACSPTRCLLSVLTLSTEHSLHMLLSLSIPATFSPFDESLCSLVCRLAFLFSREAVSHLHNWINTPQSQTLRMCPYVLTLVGETSFIVISLSY